MWPTNMMAWFKLPGVVALFVNNPATIILRNDEIFDPFLSVELFHDLSAVMHMYLGEGK